MEIPAYLFMIEMNTKQVTSLKKNGLKSKKGSKNKNWYKLRRKIMKMT